MPSPEIEEFARILVQEVRDNAVRNCDGFLKPVSNSPEARRWRQSGADPAALGFVIPDVVDGVVFCLLHAIDQGELPLRFVSSSGRAIDLTEEGQGELAGWYMGSGGWRAMFSQERFVDDFADLAE